MGKERAIDWLRYRYKGQFSELGESVAWLLDEMWGLHNLKYSSLDKVDWSNDTWIDFITDKYLCTVDNDSLTRLVVIAHQMMLRVELRGVGPGYIRLTFHQRKSRNREDGIYQWCPDIKEHIDMIAVHHPPVDK